MAIFDARYWRQLTLRKHTRPTPALMVAPQSSQLFLLARFYESDSQKKGKETGF